MSQLDALFEIGCEEIPSRMVDVALRHFEQAAGKLSEDYQLPVAKFRAIGSPRRLSLLLSGIPAVTPKQSVEKLGPAARAAFDAEGKPTKAALGFAKGLNIDPDKLIRKTTDKGEYVAAVVETGGVDATEVLTKFFASLLTTIPFAKSMRWGSEEVRFNRPVQWLVAVLFDGKNVKTLPVTFGELTAQHSSRGHRFMANEPFSPMSQEDYIAKLRERHVLVEQSERRTRVVEEAQRAAKDVGGFIFASADAPKLGVTPLIENTFYSGLVDEVTNLCEWPFGVVGSFDKSALELPREVVLSTMRGHQRYFAVVNDKGELMPNFVTIAATKVNDMALVRRGNERVLKARLNDAYYFFNEDQKRTLASRVPELQAVTYHKKLGSSWSKVERTLQLAFSIADAVGKSVDTIPALEAVLTSTTREGDFASELARSVVLSKADLVSLMVGEFPELQGLVGAHYGKKEGEPAAVCSAIAEHYWPRSAEDGLPTTDVGAIVSLADKLDTIVGIIGIGQPPSGSSDPFALRRAALGVLRILLDRKWTLSLVPIVDKAVALLVTSTEKQKADGKIHKNVEIDKNAAALVRAFIADRLLNFLLPAQPGVAANAVRAAIGAEAPEQLTSPVLAAARAQALTQFSSASEFEPLMTALKRAVNISKQKTDGDIDPSKFAHDSEKNLLAAINAAYQQKLEAQRSASAEGYLVALRAAASVRPAVDAFFDAVMVMDKDPAIKSNRLRLLQKVAGLVSDIADIEKL